MSEKYDAIVIGMGPSGIFFAYELIQLKKAKNILLIDQGKRVENRNCPIEKVGKCVKCQPYCNITSGFSGAGAFQMVNCHYTMMKMMIFMLEEFYKNI